MAKIYHRIPWTRAKRKKDLKPQNITIPSRAACEVPDVKSRVVEEIPGRGWGWRNIWTGQGDRKSLIVIIGSWVELRMTGLN